MKCIKLLFIVIKAIIIISVLHVIAIIRVARRDVILHRYSSISVEAHLVCCSVTVLQCVAVCCSVLQCVAVCCSVLQCAAVYCSALHCVCYSVLHCGVAVCVLQRVALCYSVSQCVEVCYSVLQCVIMHRQAFPLKFIHFALQHTATHCNTHLDWIIVIRSSDGEEHRNTLPHNATYCNTLQRTAAHPLP